MYKEEKRKSHSYKFNEALEPSLTKGVILYLTILGETEKEIKSLVPCEKLARWKKSIFFTTLRSDRYQDI